MSEDMVIRALNGNVKLWVEPDGGWQIQAGGYEDSGSDALREATEALEHGAGHVDAKTAEEMRCLVTGLRESDTGWV